MMQPHPSYIQFYPTLRCNRSCSFCFNAGLEELEDITLDAFRGMVNIFLRIGIREIDLLGGEPTLHPYCREMVEIASAHGMKISLSSNGSHVPLLDEILESFGESCYVGISINSPEISSELDAFISCKRPALKSLFRNKEAFDLHVSTMVSKGIPEFSAIYPDIIAGNRCDAVPFPVFHAYIERTRKRLQNVKPVYCSGFLPGSGCYPELLSTRCSAGVTKLGILPDGSVYPCNLFFGMREFCLGNIFTDSFEGIWSSPRLVFFRRFSGNRCPVKDCMLHGACHGGCPAHALKYHGTLDSPDPRCLQGDSLSLEHFSQVVDGKEQAGRSSMGALVGRGGLFKIENKAL